MKCPNCSFMNPDNSTICKICGHEFDASDIQNHPSSPESPSHHAHVQSDDDSEIEVTFDTLFGVRSNPRKMKNPLDRSKDKKRKAQPVSADSVHSESAPEPSSSFLRTPRVDSEEAPIQPEDINSEQETPETNYSEAEVTTDTIVYKPHREEEPVKQSTEESLENQAKPFVEDLFVEPQLAKEPLRAVDENTIDIELTQTGNLQNDFYTHEEDVLDSDDFNRDGRKLTIALLVVVLALIVAVFAFTSKLRGEPSPSNQQDPESPTVTKPEDSTPVASDSSKTSEALIENFFRDLPAYVNDGNISFLMYFNDPQATLDALSKVKNMGTIAKVDYTISDSESVDDQHQTLKVSTNTDRNVDGKHIISQDNWTFNTVLVDGDWLIDAFVLNSDSGSVSNQSSSSSSTDNTSNNASSSNSSSNTTTTTTPSKPEGFVSSGGFKGGVVTDGQDLSNIRYGNHDQYERLVLDLTDWQKTGTDAVVSDPCHYETTISDTGKEITITLSGVRAASAGLPSFPESSNISAINVFYPSDDSTIGLTLTLKNSSSYKVFSLKEPGRIVIDVMAGN